MKLKNGEPDRLVTDAIELERRFAAVAEDIDYEERTRAAPNPQMRAWAARLDRLVNDLSEHCSCLKGLVEE